MVKNRVEVRKMKRWKLEDGTPESEVSMRMQGQHLILGSGN